MTFNDFLRILLIRFAQRYAKMSCSSFNSRKGHCGRIWWSRFVRPFDRLIMSIAGYAVIDKTIEKSYNREVARVSAAAILRPYTVYMKDPSSATRVCKWFMYMSCYLPNDTRYRENHRRREYFHEIWSNSTSQGCTSPYPSAIIEKF